MKEGAIDFNVAFQALVMRAFAEGLSKRVWVEVSGPMIVLSNLSLGWRGDRRKEIWRGLTWRAVKSESFKIGLCLCCYSAKDHSAIIQEHGAVKTVLVHAFRGLVQSDHICHPVR